MTKILNVLLILFIIIITYWFITKNTDIAIDTFNIETEILDEPPSLDIVKPKVIKDDFNIKVINLERRPDRLKNITKQLQDNNLNYEIISAVDGNELEYSDELFELFKDNIFGYRKGVMGCALSHYNLWKDLIYSVHDYYIIMEDDAELCNRFNIKLNIIKKYFYFYDIIFLGYLKNAKQRLEYKNEYEKDTNDIKIKKLRRDLYIGGTHCYVISKSSAFKLVEFIKQYGINREIDIFMAQYQTVSKVYESMPHLAFAKWHDGLYAHIDTDIQNNFSTLI